MSDLTGWVDDEQFELIKSLYAIGDLLYVTPTKPTAGLGSDNGNPGWSSTPSKMDEVLGGSIAISAISRGGSKNIDGKVYFKVWFSDSKKHNTWSSDWITNTALRSVINGTHPKLKRNAPSASIGACEVDEKTAQKLEDFFHSVNPSSLKIAKTWDDKVFNWVGIGNTSYPEVMGVETALNLAAAGTIKAGLQLNPTGRGTFKPTIHIASQKYRKFYLSVFQFDDPRINEILGVKPDPIPATAATLTPALVPTATVVPTTLAPPKDIREGFVSKEQFEKLNALLKSNTKLRFAKEIKAKLYTPGYAWLCLNTDGCADLHAMAGQEASVIQKEAANTSGVANYYLPRIYFADAKGRSWYVSVDQLDDPKIDEILGRAPKAPVATAPTPVATEPDRITAEQEEKLKAFISANKGISLKISAKIADKEATKHLGWLGISDRMRAKAGQELVVYDPLSNHSGRAMINLKAPDGTHNNYSVDLIDDKRVDEILGRGVYAQQKFVDIPVGTRFMWASTMNGNVYNLAVACVKISSADYQVISDLSCFPASAVSQEILVVVDPDQNAKVNFVEFDDLEIGREFSFPGDKGQFQKDTFYVKNSSTTYCAGAPNVADYSHSIKSTWKKEWRGLVANPNQKGLHVVAPAETALLFKDIPIGAEFSYHSSNSNGFNVADFAIKSGPGMVRKTSTSVDLKTKEDNLVFLNPKQAICHTIPNRAFKFSELPLGREFSFANRTKVFTKSDANVKLNAEEFRKLGMSKAAPCDPDELVFMNSSQNIDTVWPKTTTTKVKSFFDLKIGDKFQVWGKKNTSGESQVYQKTSDTEYSYGARPYAWMTTYDSEYILTVFERAPSRGSIRFKFADLLIHQRFCVAEEGEYGTKPTRVFVKTSSTDFKNITLGDVGRWAGNWDDTELFIDQNQHLKELSFIPIESPVVEKAVEPTVPTTTPEVKKTDELSTGVMVGGAAVASGLLALLAAIKKKNKQRAAAKVQKKVEVEEPEFIKV